MIRSATDYLRLLQSLLPRGKAWNREEGSVLTEFLHGDAEEFARVDSRSADLLIERDTRYASELLIDHEIDLGLPDECSLGHQTIQERRLAAHSKLIALGQQNPAYFIELAAAYGWTVTVTEYSPFWSGVGRAGDPCGDQWVIFYWKITLSYGGGGGGEIVYFLCGGSECGDSLAYLPGTDAMTCHFSKYKPAHTVLIFDYEGPEYGYGFDLAFDSMPSTIEGYLRGAFGQEFGLGIDVHLGGGFDFHALGNSFRKPGYGADLPIDEEPAFIFEVKTTGANETFALPLEAPGTYDFDIDWGDGGNGDNITAWNQAEITHTYASADTYTVIITGTITGWRFNNGGDKTKIYDISHWGPLKLGSSGNYFHGCSNLTVSAVDVLDVSATTTFSSAFNGCTSLTTMDVSSWDVSSVTTFASAFYGCSALVTLDVSSWDTGAATILSSAFRNCTSLAALDVSSWNISLVTHFDHTFRNCTSLTALDVSLWDVSLVTGFNYTFAVCSSITALDVSSWDTGAVTNFSYAFREIGLTTIPIETRDITACTNMTLMFHDVTLTTACYDAILLGWEAQIEQPNVTFSAGNSKYTGGGAVAAARAALVANGWIITDGGIA